MDAACDGDVNLVEVHVSALHRKVDEPFGNTKLTYRTPQLRNAYVSAYSGYDFASLTTDRR